MSTRIDICPEYINHIDPDVAAKTSLWRNSLFCVAQTIPVMYIAVGDHIHVYAATNVSASQALKPLEVIENPRVPPRPCRPYGAQPGPFDGEAINVLATFMLGDTEVLVSGDGLGRIIIREIQALQKTPICYNVGSSVWGLDIKGRLLAASANSQEVLLFDMQKSSAAACRNDQAAEMVVLVGSFANIPSVCISNDGALVACVDIAGRLWMFDTDCPNNRQSLYTFFQQRASFPQWDRGWGCCLLPQSAFRKIATTMPERGHANLVRSLYPKLKWWEAMGANVAAHLDPEPEDHINLYRGVYSMSYHRRPEEHFEQSWQGSSSEIFTTSQQLMLPIEEKVQLLLVTTTDMITLLLSNNLDKFHAVCSYPFGSKYILDHDMERINMVKALPECGIVAVGTQRGQVCILELIKCIDASGEIVRASFSFRCYEVDKPGGIYGQEDEILGLDLNMVADCEARLTIMYRSGKIRAVRINVKNADADALVLADIKL